MDIPKLTPEEKRKISKRLYYEANREAILAKQTAQKTERYKNDPEFRAVALARSKSKYVPKKTPKEEKELVEKKD
jgi:hypothetical protein